MNIETMKLALEALNVYACKAEHKRTHADNCQAEEAITALRQAIEKAQKQEPDDQYCNACDGDQCTAKAGCVALSNPPPQRQPLTDDALIQKMLDAGFERNSLGWTFTYGRLDYHLLKFARAIEAAHGIKGEA